MSTLESAVLEGVWGERNISLTFHPDVNFLIGVNGSGKTTIINLIAAALTGDHESLARIPFSRISCRLTGASEASACEVEITRSVGERGARRQYFHYKITRKDGSEEYDLGLPSYAFLEHSVSPQRLVHGRIFDVAERLQQIVSIKWLPVHRTPSKPRNTEQSSEPSVDKRLTQLGNQLVRYFSKLAARRDEETSSFLKQLFPVLVSQSSEESNFLTKSSDIDFGALRDSVDDLIQQLGLGNRVLERHLNNHFKLAMRAAEKHSYSSAELAALIASSTMQRVVARWNRSLVKQAEIAQPRREFLEILNSMFIGKQLIINQRNELEAVLTSEKRLALSELSSGEKQLLVILAEALLQERSESIYIADEPELSLHVRWQEQLTRNLRKINPKAQVIFATHSPDVVSEYSENIIDVERLG